MCMQACVGASARGGGQWRFGVTEFLSLSPYSHPPPVYTAESLHTACCCMSSHQPLSGKLSVLGPHDTHEPGILEPGWK